MKTIAVLAVLASGLAQAQVKMEVTIGGRAVGNATLTQKVGTDGVKTVQLAMQQVSADRTVKVRTESTFKPDGSPIRKFQETTVAGQRYRRQIIATFSNTEAVVVTDLNGDRTTRRYPIPAGAHLANASEFWFIKVRPEVGTKIESTTLDMEKMQWETVTVEYVGKTDIKVGGRTVKANLCKSSKGSAYFDDNGLLVRLELPNARLDRTWEK